MANKTNCTKNGVKYYKVYLELGRDSQGKRKRKEFYGKSKKEAEARRDEYANGLKTGLNVDSRNVSIGKLMHMWLFEVVRVSKDIKASSFERYEAIYRLYVKDSDIYGIKISEVKSINIQKYYNKLYDLGKRSTLIYNINKLLRTFFNYAITEGYIIKNPCSGKSITIPGEKGIIKENPEKLVFSDEEFKTFQLAIKKHRLKVLFYLALFCGLREGELLALKWSDIDLNNKTLSVNKSLRYVTLIKSDGSKKREMVIQTPKSETSIRTIFLDDNLIPILEDHKKLKESEKLKAGDIYNDSDFIFTTALGLNIDPRNLLRAYKRVLTKAEIPYRKFHSLRHTCATKLFERDTPLTAVQNTLGHSDIKITNDIYTHVMAKKKIETANKLSDLFIE